jgi:hypothetical protein
VGDAANGAMSMMLSSLSVDAAMLRRADLKT